MTCTHTSPPSSAWRRRVTARGAFAAIVLAFAVVGCGKDDAEEQRQRMAASEDPHHGGATAMPPSSSPHAGAPMGMNAPAGPDDGQPVPLKQTGIGSAAELQRELPHLGDAEAAAKFDSAFRLTFSSDPTKRDFVIARRMLNEILAKHSNFAPAYRALAYAQFNIDPSDTRTALENYDKAVELAPAYGEAHYAIAFMCAATGDRTKGVQHYNKAMALGVPDERGIGQRFYADLLAPQ